MLSDKQGNKRMTFETDYTVFDLETTGVSTVKDEVVEISALRVRDREVVEEFSMLVNPGIPIPMAASAVNGIYDSMVASAPPFDVALKVFADFIGDDVLVGHNISRFDMKFLWRDAVKYWGKMIGNDYADTLMLAWRHLPKLPKYTLSDLASYYGIDTAGAHRALADCRMNQQVFEALRKEAEQPSEEAKNVRVCPRCGNILKKRNGKFGAFFGCMGFPDCRYTENI